MRVLSPRQRLGSRSLHPPPPPRWGPDVRMQPRSVKSGGCAQFPCEIFEELVVGTSVWNMGESFNVLRGGGVSLVVCCSVCVCVSSLSSHVGVGKPRIYWCDSHQPGAPRGWLPRGDLHLGTHTRHTQRTRCWVPQNIKRLLYGALLHTGLVYCKLVYSRPELPPRHPSTRTSGAESGRKGESCGV